MSKALPEPCTVPFIQQDPENIRTRVRQFPDSVSKYFQSCIGKWAVMHSFHTQEVPAALGTHVDN